MKNGVVQGLVPRYLSNSPIHAVLKLQAAHSLHIFIFRPVIACLKAIGFMKEVRSQDI